MDFDINMDFDDDDVLPEVTKDFTYLDILEVEDEYRKVSMAVGIFLRTYVVVIFAFFAIIFISKVLRFERCSIPTVNCHPILFYFSALLSVYKQSRPEVPPLCLVLLGITGVCRIAAKQKLFCIYVLFKPFIIFFKPETVEVLLSSATLIDKSKEYELLSPWLGTGLLTSTGKKWRRRRKLLTPAFHFSILDEFIPVFQEQSRVLVSKFQSLVHEPWVDVVPLMTACTLDIICQTAMGVNIDAQGGRNTEYVRAVHEIGEAFMYRILRPWLYPNFIFKWTAYGRRFYDNLRRVQSLTKEVIKHKRQDMEAREEYAVIEPFSNHSPSQRKKRKAFLELLLEHHLKDPSFTEEDVSEEVHTFMFEGHDTTAMAVSWALYCLGQNPEIQQRVQEELDDIFEDDIDRDIEREDLTRMKYLECVIKETLRLYPSVPFIARECKNSFRVLDHKVPPRSLCLILTCELHQDPESFPEPEKFIPERFFPENSKGRHPYAYVPFSAGPRNCIGQKFAIMEEKIVLANILRKFLVTSLDPRDKVLVTPNLTTKNVKPLRLRFEPRSLQCT